MRTGLLLEGGAMRCMYTEGVIDVFLENEIEGFNVDTENLLENEVFTYKQILEERKKINKVVNKLTTDLIMYINLKLYMRLEFIMNNILKTEIKKHLFEIADEKYKEFYSGLCPNTDNILGVRVPILREYAKQLVKENDIQYLLENIDNEYYEEIMLQGMTIGQAKEKDFEKIKKWIKDFIPKIDNWAVCDVFCAGLKFTKKYEKEMWQLIQEYLKSSKEFYLRFAIVMILDFYIKEEYLDKDLEIFNNIKSDKYYVQMAVAWAISICLIKYYDRTIGFLRSGNCKLDDFTYNKSLQKARESYRISKEQKEELQAMKRSK